MKTSHIQSIVGVASRTDYGLLNVSKKDRPHTVTFDGQSFLVGAGTELFSRAVNERMDLERLGDSAEGRALTFATLGNLLGYGDHRVSIMVGFPVNLMLDGQRAKAMRRELRRWLLGTHTFSFNGVQTEVTVDKLNVYSQPAAARASWALSNDGRAKISGDDAQATVAVCDLGFNTLDLQVIQPNGNIIPHQTGGETSGMRRAAEALRAAVFNAYGNTLSLHQADQYIQGGATFLETRGGMVDIAQLVAQAKAQCAGGVTQYVNTLWENLNASVILFAGGGSQALKRELLQHFPTGRILRNPVMAIADGLAKVAKNAYPGSRVIGLDPGFGAFKGVLL